MLTFRMGSEAQRRYAWNEKWFGGRYQGVMQQADQRMREIERLNEDIEYME